MAYLISEREYQELFRHVYQTLGGKENVPASFPEFQERLENSGVEIVCGSTGEEMSLFGSAYQDVCKNCTHRLKHTLKYLRNLYPTDYRKTIEVILWNGGHCDCELLMNVSVDEYMRCRYEPVGGDFTVWEWQKMVDDWILNDYRMPATKPAIDETMQQMDLW